MITRRRSGVDRSPLVEPVPQRSRAVNNPPCGSGTGVHEQVTDVGDRPPGRQRAQSLVGEGHFAAGEGTKDLLDVRFADPGQCCLGTGLQARAWVIDPQDLAQISPYLTKHINRFGAYPTHEFGVVPEDYDTHLDVCFSVLDNDRPKAA
jgi:hypothetical protein